MEDDDDFEMRATESLRFAVDFKRNLATGIVLTGPTVTVTLEEGIDADPSGIKDGNAAISGQQVSQLFTPAGRPVGNKYTVLFGADTSDGQYIDEPRCLEIIDTTCC